LLRKLSGWSAGSNCIFIFIKNLFSDDSIEIEDKQQKRCKLIGVILYLMESCYCQEWLNARKQLSDMLLQLLCFKFMYTAQTL